MNSKGVGRKQPTLDFFKVIIQMKTLGDTTGKSYMKSLNKTSFKPGNSRKQFGSLTPSDNLHSSTGTENYFLEIAP